MASLRGRRSQHVAAAVDGVKEPEQVRAEAADRGHGPVPLGFGRIVGSEKQIPNTLVNPL